jgi:hypothetical protein
MEVFMFIDDSQCTSTMAAVAAAIVEVHWPPQSPLLHLNNVNHCFIPFFELFAKVRAET